MTIKIKERATEASTYLITLTITDEDGSPMTPNTAVWSLVDQNGTVVNERSNIPFGVLGPTMEVLLSGDDLLLPGSDIDDEFRIIVVEGTYDSSHGSNLPFVYDAEFRINNVITK